MCGKKMKVCFVRWSAVGFFYKFIFEALALEAVSVVVQVIPKMFVQGTKVSSLQGANRVAGNVLQVCAVRVFGEGFVCQDKCS